MRKQQLTLRAVLRVPLRVRLQLSAVWLAIVRTLSRKFAYANSSVRRLRMGIAYRNKPQPRLRWRAICWPRTKLMLTRTLSVHSGAYRQKMNRRSEERRVGEEGR